MLQAIADAGADAFKVRFKQGSSIAVAAAEAATLAYANVDINAAQLMIHLFGPHRPLRVALLQGGAIFVVVGVPAQVQAAILQATNAGFNWTFGVNIEAAADAATDTLDLSSRQKAKNFAAKGTVGLVGTFNTFLSDQKFVVGMADIASPATSKETLLMGRLFQCATFSNVVGIVAAQKLMHYEDISASYYANVAGTQKEPSKICDFIWSAPPSVDVVCLEYLKYCWFTPFDTTTTTLTPSKQRGALQIIKAAYAQNENSIQWFNEVAKNAKVVDSGVNDANTSNFSRNNTISMIGVRETLARTSDAVELPFNGGKYKFDNDEQKTRIINITYDRDSVIDLKSFVTSAQPTPILSVHATVLTKGAPIEGRPPSRSPGALTEVLKFALLSKWNITKFAPSANGIALPDYVLALQLYNQVNGAVATELPNDILLQGFYIAIRHAFLVPLPADQTNRKQTIYAVLLYAQKLQRDLGRPFPANEEIRDDFMDLIRLGCGNVAFDINAFPGGVGGVNMDIRPVFNAAVRLLIANIDCVAGIPFVTWLFVISFRVKVIMLSSLKEDTLNGSIAHVNGDPKRVCFVTGNNIGGHRNVFDPTDGTAFPADDRDIVDVLTLCQHESPIREQVPEYPDFFRTYGTATVAECIILWKKTPELFEIVSDGTNMILNYAQIPPEIYAIVAIMVEMSTELGTIVDPWYIYNSYFRAMREGIAPIKIPTMKARVKVGGGAPRIRGDKKTSSRSDKKTSNRGRKVQQTDDVPDDAIAYAAESRPDISKYLGSSGAPDKQQKHMDSDSKLAIYTVIDIIMYPGESIPTLMQPVLKCYKNWEGVSEAWAKLRNTPYVPSELNIAPPAPNTNVTPGLKPSSKSSPQVRK